MSINKKECAIKAISSAKEEISKLRNKLFKKEEELIALKNNFQKEYGPLFLCRICGQPHEDQRFAEDFNNLLICNQCGDRSLTKGGKEPYHNDDLDDGDNPLYIDEIKVWRRYKFGGYITLIDEHDCSDVMEFYQKHFNIGV